MVTVKRQTVLKKKRPKRVICKNVHLISRATANKCSPTRMTKHQS
jgi:hypothetical protein